MKRTNWLGLGLATLVACSVAGCGDEDTSNEERPVNLSGTWDGNFADEGQAVAGTVNIVVTHEGEELNGTASLTGAPCFSSVRFRGIFDDETNWVVASLLDDGDVGKLVTLEGSYFPDTDSLELAYDAENWGVCTGQTGNLTASRSSTQ